MVLDSKDSLAQPRVLVVDNDSFTLDLAEILLNDLGVDDVLLASSGEAALAAVDDAHRSPSIIFCDLAMEGMDGIEVIRHLAGRRYAGHLVLLSGSNHQLMNAVSRMARANRLNLLGTMPKPLSGEKFATMLARSNAARLNDSGSARMELTSEMIRAGLDRGAIEAYVQPKVRTATKEIKGGEVLLRWRHSDNSMVSPLAVIPVAESSGLIDEITKEIYLQATAAMSTWRQAGWNTVLSVNVSARNLLDLPFPEWLNEQAALRGVDVQAIMLEVTESQLVENLGSSLDVISRLYLMGFRLSIDDFGTGYSNFDQIKQLPIREIKIDRSLVLGASEDESGRAILQAAVELGRALGVSVTAEGVETADEWAMLERMGCDVIQGFYVSRPMPIGDFLAWRDEWNAALGMSGLPSSKVKA